MNFHADREYEESMERKPSIVLIKMKMKLQLFVTEFNILKQIEIV